MNLFDTLVNQALQNQAHLNSLKTVVEKELLHHEILRIMRDYYLTRDLTFIGGTCLRTCYGGVRLSEDLDFNGGFNFSRDQLSTMGKILKKNLQDKYALKVFISEPIKDKKNVSTWKIKVETRPELKSFPTQRINIDICALTSYEKYPMLIINPYKVDLGTSGLIIQAQSCEEIYIDKIIAFAFRPNQIKYRDLWDIFWLHGKNIKPRLELIHYKLKDRKHTHSLFLELFNTRLQLIKKNPDLKNHFKKEMLRFLPSSIIKKNLDQDNAWSVIIYLIEDLKNKIIKP